MYSLSIKTHFDAAHYIRDYEGKCARLHGHRWDVELLFQGKKLQSNNILLDFSVLKSYLKKLVDDKLDHYCLNETLNEENVTAEFLAAYVFKMVDDCIFHKVAEAVELRLALVRVWESPDCYVQYDGLD